MSASNNLVLQAEKGALPDFQYMDNETCKWIAANNPGHWLRRSHVALAVDTLYLPLPTAWFLDSRIEHSLHGVRHAIRVAYYCLLLAEMTGLQPCHKQRVAMAGLLHDIRRQDDKRDATHGGRTAHWLGQNAAAIQKEWRITITNEDIRAMAAIIALHESPYTDLTDEELTTYQKYTQETDILKTADALDRYRMPKLKWWPNDAYLRLLPPAWLKQTAYETVLKSETLFLKNNDSLTSVWEVVKSNATQ